MSRCVVCGLLFFHRLNVSIAGDENQISWMCGVGCLLFGQKLSIDTEEKTDRVWVTVGDCG